MSTFKAPLTETDLQRRPYSVPTTTALVAFFQPLSIQGDPAFSKAILREGIWTIVNQQAIVGLSRRAKSRLFWMTVYFKV